MFSTIFDKFDIFFIKKNRLLLQPNILASRQLKHMRKFAEFSSSKNVVESKKIIHVIIYPRLRKPIHPSDHYNPDIFDKAARLWKPIHPSEHCNPNIFEQAT